MQRCLRVEHNARVDVLTARGLMTMDGEYITARDQYFFDVDRPAFVVFEVTGRAEDFFSVEIDDNIFVVVLVEHCPIELRAVPRKRRAEPDISRVPTVRVAPAPGVPDRPNPLWPVFHFTSSNAAVIQSSAGRSIV